MRTIYFKRKAGEPILETASGIQLPDIIIVPTSLDVMIKDKLFIFTWGFFLSAQAYLNGNSPIQESSLNLQPYAFEFTETSVPDFQTALNQFDWASGGEYSQAGAQIILDFFATQPDPTTPEETDLIGDHWDGMIYNP